MLSQGLDNLVEAGNDRVRQVVSRYPHRKMLDDKEYTPKRLLEKLGFTNDDMNEPVCDLSGGQKPRLALMMLLLDEPNVLILDEPGNDLDTDMLAAVEDLLASPLQQRACRCPDRCPAHRESERSVRQAEAS